MMESVIWHKILCKHYTISTVGVCIADDNSKQQHQVRRHGRGGLGVPGPPLWAVPLHMKILP